MIYDVSGSKKYDQLWKAVVSFYKAQLKLLKDTKLPTGLKKKKFKDLVTSPKHDLTAVNIAVFEQPDISIFQFPAQTCKSRQRPDQALRLHKSHPP